MSEATALGCDDTSVAGHQQRPAADRRVIHEPADELDFWVPPDELHGKITTHTPSLDCADPSFLRGLVQENRALYALRAGCPPRWA